MKKSTLKWFKGHSLTLILTSVTFLILAELREWSILAIVDTVISYGLGLSISGLIFGFIGLMLNHKTTPLTDEEIKEK